MCLITLYRKRKAKKRCERIKEMAEVCTSVLENGFQYYSKYLALHICFLMLKNHISREQIADAMGYSEYDMDRLLSGVLIVPPAELEEIADILGTTKKDLLRKSMEDYYDTRGITERNDCCDERS